MEGSRDVLGMPAYMQPIYQLLVSLDEKMNQLCDRMGRVEGIISKRKAGKRVQEEIAADMEQCTPEECVENEILPTTEYENIPGNETIIVKAEQVTESEEIETWNEKATIIKEESDAEVFVSDKQGVPTEVYGDCHVASGRLGLASTPAMHPNGPTRVQNPSQVSTSDKTVMVPGLETLVESHGMFRDYEHDLTYDISNIYFLPGGKRNRGRPRKFSLPFEVDRLVVGEQTSEMEVTTLETGNLPSEGPVQKEADPVMCVVCGKRFFNRGSLRRHLITVHLGQRHYRCDECGKTFKQSNALAYHKKTHAKENPFSCHKCHRRFLAEPCLLEHIASCAPHHFLGV